MTSLLDRIRSDPLGALREGISLAQQGRQAIAAVVDAVKDGTVAISTTDQPELDQMLATEEVESRAAHGSLKDAIADARAAGQG